MLWSKAALHLPRQYLVGQTGGGVHHPPSHATGTEGTSLTGKGDDAFVSAVFTANPQETMSQHAAVEVGAQLPLDVGG